MLAEKTASLVSRYQESPMRLLVTIEITNLSSGALYFAAGNFTGIARTGGPGFLLSSASNK
jgi:hypothetical protein